MLAAYRIARHVMRGQRPPASTACWRASPLVGHLAIDEVLVSAANDDLQGMQQMRRHIVGGCMLASHRSHQRQRRRRLWLAHRSTNGRHRRPHRPGDSDVLLVLVSRGPVFGVVIVEHDGDSGLGDTSRSLLVHELLQRLGPHLQISYTHVIAGRTCTLPGPRARVRQGFPPAAGS